MIRELHSAPTRLLVARHGETEDNAAHRWQGWNDSNLTARGEAQAVALGRRLAREPLAALYSSDLGRTLRTSVLASGEGQRLLPIADPGLRERDAGLFSGLMLDELNARFPAEMEQRQGAEADWAPPEGESLRGVLERVMHVLDRIGSLHPGQTVAVITHGGVIRVLATYATEENWSKLWNLHATNCGLSEFTWYGPGRLTLERLDEHDYLETLAPSTAVDLTPDADLSTTTE